MTIFDYYNEGHTIDECAEMYGLASRTVIDRLREYEAEIDIPITKNLYKTYEWKINFIRELFGYKTDLDMDQLKKTDFESWFILSWIRTTELLTGKRQ